MWKFNPFLHKHTKKLLSLIYAGKVVAPIELDRSGLVVNTKLGRLSIVKYSKYNIRIFLNEGNICSHLSTYQLTKVYNAVDKLYEKEMSLIRQAKQLKLYNNAEKVLKDE